MKPTSICRLDKQLLAQVLGMSNQTLTRWINVNKKRILDKFPDYKDTAKQIDDPIFHFICKQHGLNDNMTAERIKNFRPEYEETPIDKIIRIHGLY